MKKDKLIIHDDIASAYKCFWEYKPLNAHLPLFPFEKEHYVWKFGDYFLFQHINEENEISRPRLGMFIKFGVVDQALDVLFAENDRAWMNSHGVYTNKEIKYSMPLSHLHTNIHNIIFWSENIHLLGHWSTRPNISQLKQALSYTLNPPLPAAPETDKTT